MFKTSNPSSTSSVAKLQVSRGRFGRRIYRDPRFDHRHECRDCTGSGRCPISDQPESCLTCVGSGVIDTWNTAPVAGR